MTSKLCESWFPFYKCKFYQEEYIVYVIITVLLPSCMEEFIDFGFQVSGWNFDKGHIKS